MNGARMLVFVASFIILMGGGGFVSYANDYQENTKLTIVNRGHSHNGTIGCWSVNGLNLIKDEYVLVYDYARDHARYAGESRMPWTIVVQGECYPIYGDEYVYIFKKPLHPHVADLLAHVAVYEPSANLEDYLRGAGNCTSEGPYGSVIYGPCFDDDLQMTRKKIVDDAFLAVPTWWNGATLYAPALNAVRLLPTRYEPDDGFKGWPPYWPHGGPGSESTSHISTGDVRYQIAFSLLERIASEIQSSLRGCAPIEIRRRVGQYTGHDPHDIIWRTSEYGNVVINEYYGDIPFSDWELVEIMGCTERLQTYMKRNKETIVYLDSLISELYSAYTDGPYYTTFATRTPAEIATLKRYAFEGVRPTINTSILTIAPELERVSQEFTFATDTNATPSRNAATTTVAPLFEPTTLQRDGETSTSTAVVNTQHLNKGTSWLVYVYFALPLFGGLALAYIYYRSRKEKRGVAIKPINTNKVDEQESHGDATTE